MHIVDLPQVNVLDLVASLAEHHPRLLQELTTFAAAETEAAAGAHPLTPPSPSAADSACAVNWFCTSSQEARPLHVPDFLPAYPSVHTYTFTPCAVPRRRESAAIRKHLGRLRRGAGAKMLQMHRPLTPSAQRHPPPTNVLPPPAVGAPLPALTAESDVVASITALPFKHAYERELSTTQGEARAMSSRQSDILQRQHVRGLEEAGNEEVVNNTDGPAA
mmetsp:Transcript_15818/g.44468  ORF Transcript_15818/g.44468 Transcript_15818/m.44468 type:complete len:219 (-) Transcript_15818:746-1402(-)